MYTEEQIEKALFEARSLCLAKIVRHHDGFIILAQNEKDYKSKVQKIQRGDTKGFYTVERALYKANVSRRSETVKNFSKILDIMNRYKQEVDNGIYNHKEAMIEEIISRFTIVSNSG